MNLESKKCYGCVCLDLCLESLNELPEDGCGEFVATTEWTEKQEGKVKEDNEKANGRETVTLCSDCKVLSCSWMRELKPVEGWTAIKDYVKNKVVLPSYRVLECPEFEKMECVKKNERRFARRRKGTSEK